MSSIQSRLKRLERIQRKKPPTDLFGCYYDELPETDKIRYMRYVYGSDYKNLEYAERVEQRARSTLHFICSSKELDINLDSDLFAALGRSLELN